jgi:hypothetical protein
MLRKVLVAVFTLAAAFVLVGQNAPEKLAPFYPTPETVVRQMLELGALKKGEWHYDLGSGDGRVVIMAAQKFGAHSMGFEIDDELYNKSMERIRQLGLQNLATIVKQDLMTADFGKPDLITVYLLPTSNDKLAPFLEKSMKKGARIVSHDFEFSAWKPEKSVTVEDNDEGYSRSHTLYLYRR